MFLSSGSVLVQIVRRRERCWIRLFLVKSGHLHAAVSARGLSSLRTQVAGLLNAVWADWRGYVQVYGCVRKGGKGCINEMSDEALSGLCCLLGIFLTVSFSPSQFPGLCVQESAPSLDLYLCVQRNGASARRKSANYHLLCSLRWRNKHVCTIGFCCCLGVNSVLLNINLQKQNVCVYQLSPY